MPRTTGDNMSPIELGEIGEGIREMQITQTLAGLRAAPQLLPRLQDMAARGDPTTVEVLRRYRAQNP